METLGSYDVDLSVNSSRCGVNTILALTSILIT